jgi:hypothetical protein
MKRLLSSLISYRARTALLALVAAWSVGGGCAHLDPIDENVCGNGVLEPAMGEDCDGDEGCAAPGTPHECRFLCSSTQACPSGRGFGCGADGVCRAPSGAFTALSIESTPTTIDMLVGDTDANGCAEIVTTNVHGTEITALESRVPGICAAGSQSILLKPVPPDETSFPSPFLTELTGNHRPELVVPNGGVVAATSKMDQEPGTATINPSNGALFVHSSDIDPSFPLAPAIYTSEQFSETGVRALKVSVKGKDRLLLFLGPAPAPPVGEPTPHTCPMTTPTDGGMPPPDGGMMMMDGGMPPPDGGMMMMDGGMPPPDGGMPPPDGGTPPPDGGTMTMDGGMPPPPDGGCPLPPDGGTPPPPLPDGGCPPPPDGGPPPPPPDPTNPATALRVAILEDAHYRARTLAPDLGKTFGDLVAMAATDIDGDGCDEVVLAFAGASDLAVYTTCDAQKNLVFSPYKVPSVKLDGGAKVRSFNPSLLVYPSNPDDPYTDILLLADDCRLHIAFGTAQHGFGSTPPGGPGAGNGEMSLLDIQDPNITSQLQNPNTIVVAGKFTINAPSEKQLVAATCPNSAVFASDVCDPIPGDCEAAVVDIDRDGLEDIITTQGQELGLVVSRSVSNGLGFHLSTLDTECPPHHLATGDFDDDGVADVAFFDQAPLGGGGKSTVLKIAYGKAYAAPEPPRIVGTFAHAEALVSGMFTQTPPGQQLSQAQLFAARTFWTGAAMIEGSGVGLVVGDSDRQGLAPIYIPALLDVGTDKARLDKIELIAAAEGRFVVGADGTIVNESDTTAARGVAVVAREDGSATLGLWLLHRNQQDGGIVAVRADAAKDIACDSCVLAAADTDDDGIDELLLFEDRPGSGPELVIFHATAQAFDAGTKKTTTYGFRSIETGTNPVTYVPRPLVAALEPPPKGMKNAPVDVVLRAKTGELVAFWGDGKGGFEERKLFDAPCDVTKCQGRQAIARVRLDDATTPKLVVVGPGLFGFYDLKDRAPVAVDTGLSADVLATVKPKEETTFTAVSAADIDGDGVDDLVIMPSSSSIHVLRGTPVLE